MQGTVLETKTDGAERVALTCDACGTVSAPDGACLEIGECERADDRATRSASRETAKAVRAPAAWTSSGWVD